MDGGAARATGGRFRPGRWGWLLILTGAGAFLGMTELGHVVAIMCLIVIVGIPIYLLLAALPSIFLVLLFLRLLVGAVSNIRAGHAAWGLAFAAAGLFMLDYFVLRAQWANAALDARARALVAGDVAGPARIPPGGVMATVRVERALGRAPEDVCDDLCQRLLLNGFARRVLVAAVVPQRAERGARPEPPALEPAPGMTGTMYWLEARPVCPETNAPDSVRALRVDASAAGAARANPRPVSESMRVKIASGTCLVSGPATLDQADGAFFYGDIAHGGGLAYGFDIARDTIGAWRTAYFRRAGDQWIVEHRQTGVRYLRFPGALIPGYVHGPELRIYNGFLRSVRLLGARERHADSAPVAETLAQLGVNLRVDDAAQADGRQIVDAILASKDPVSSLQASIVEDYLDRLSSGRGARLEPDDAGRVLAIVGDARIDFTWKTQRAVARIAQHHPERAPELARLLFARLDAILASSIAGELATRSAGALSNALAALPDEALKPYFAHIEAVATSSAFRPVAANLVARLHIFGASAAPLMFRVIDESLAERAPGRSGWRTGLTGGLRALCRLGGEGAFARPMFEERIRANGEPFVNVNDRLVVAILVRMGAGEAQVRELLGSDEKKESRIRSAIRAANGQRPCE